DKQCVNGSYLCHRPCVDRQESLAGVVLAARTGDLEPVMPSVHRGGGAHYHQLRCLGALVTGAVAQVVPAGTLVDLPYCCLPCPGIEHLRIEDRTGLVTHLCISRFGY